MMGFIAIFSWPVFATYFFNRFHLGVAICVTVVAGYLFLPTRVGFDLPLLPSIDKVSVPAIMALMLAVLGVGAAAKRGGKAIVKVSIIPKSKLLLLLVLAVLLSGIGTAYSNSDVLQYGPVVLRRLRLFDGLSMGLNALVMILPLLVGYAFLRRPEEHRTILIVLAVFGVIYSVLALYEIRMSPQLNRTFYGFFPHSWVQHKRGGGWRPILFLQHGLFVGIFLSMSALAALTILRQAADEWRSKALTCSLVIGVTLLLSSNLGATMIMIAMAAVIFVLTPRMQLVVAACFAGLVLIYPMARGAGVVPTQSVVNFAATINTDRADSLEYRLDNEDILIAKANQRPIFGWGGWTRARVYDERGRDISITDGLWVIVFGEGGWIGYITEMGLLCLPVILLAVRNKRYSIDAYTAGLSIVLAANLIDLLPNAGISPITWMIAGAMWGRLALGQVVKADEEVAETVQSPLSAYTRQTGRIDRNSPLPKPSRSRRHPERST